MEIIKLTSGQVQDREIRFSEGIFGNDDVQFYIFAIDSGELILLVRSELSMEALTDSVREDDDFYLEYLLAYCMESDMERYECWDGDGRITAFGILAIVSSRIIPEYRTKKKTKVGITPIPGYNSNFSYEIKRRT